MSIPPQLIRVKRKRVDETPVTFLQFDQDSTKRHRSGSHWAYQRRLITGQNVGDSSKQESIILVSAPGDALRPGQQSQQQDALSIERNKLVPPFSGPLEPRRFHVFQSSLNKRGTQSPGSGAVFKRNRYGPAVFVESTRRKKIPKTQRILAAEQLTQSENETQPADVMTESHVAETEQLKRPGVAKKKLSQQQPVKRAPLPDSFSQHHENMDKITDEMNQWVLSELGANLRSMEPEQKPLRFKPKSPAKRFHERHPDLAPPPSASASDQPDVAMSDASDDEGDDDEWIIDEYVRIPAKSVSLDVSPLEVGILILDEEEESQLFFGSPDDDDELELDEEDENAENYYTADYPEDEVDSEDECGRYAHVHSHCNDSDQEEFDQELYAEEEEEQDEAVLEGDDNDAIMARIRGFVKRNPSFPTSGADSAGARRDK